MPDPAHHVDTCDHDLPLCATETEWAYSGTCARCGAKNVCVGCRSADGECYCDVEYAGEVQP